MNGYELKITLTGCSHKISRTITVPETISFTELAYDLKAIFDLTPFKISSFGFPGLNTPLWDSNDEIPINDFLDLFKKFTWEYSSKSLTFSVKVKKTSKANEYAVVKSFEGNCNPLDYRSAYEFDEILFEIEANERGLEDITTFDMDAVNEKLKG